MYKIGIVGTGAITLEFLKCINEDFNQKCQVISIFSRTEYNADQYCKNNGIQKGFTDYNLFVDSVDIVYIASPNSIHFNQTKIALENSRHVIVEKPIAMTSDEISHLYDLSYINNVLLIEGVVSVCNPILNDIKKYLKDVRHVNFNMMQQTRFIDEYYSNKHVNVFDETIGGGVMYDLGIYPIYLALLLFSTPKKSNVFLIKENNYAPLTSNIVLNYENFNCNINISKLVSSEPSYISTLNHLLVIDNVGDIKSVKIYDHKKNLINKYSICKNKMFYQVNHFIELLESDIMISTHHTRELSLAANQIIIQR